MKATGVIAVEKGTGRIVAGAPTVEELAKQFEVSGTWLVDVEIEFDEGKAIDWQKGKAC